MDIADIIVPGIIMAARSHEPMARCSIDPTLNMLKKVEADGQTEDGWTLVQYKYSSNTLGPGKKAIRRDWNGPSVEARECKAFTKMSKIVKCYNTSTILLMERIHEGEWK